MTNYIKQRNKIKKAFLGLRKWGYFAEMDFECCTSCAHAAIPEGTTKYIYYNRQTTEFWRQSGKLELSWGGDSIEIVWQLRKAGLNVWHDGKQQAFIIVSNEPFTQMEIDRLNARW
jgi:hypothetical protein